MSQLILESLVEGMAVVTLNRPAVRNAMTLQMWTQLRLMLQRYAADATVRCVVVTAAGDAFCAGGDVAEFVANLDAPERADEDSRVADLRQLSESVRLLHEMPKPTLAVIPGAAAGAGFCLALACDLRICADTAVFTTAFSRVGTSGDFGGSWFLSRIIGAARTQELYLRSEIISAQKAFDWGIVNRIVPSASLSAEAELLARELASGPTRAFGYMKKNLDVALTGSLERLLEVEALHMIRTLATEDHRSASSAFLRKRPPVFSGR
jgi:2-(1,2-epoxy-1,2-dihydrophenyl)acetyl-CoA isomerase